MSARNAIILTSLARQDLVDIQIYTEQRWGSRQRSAYKAKLYDALQELAKFPEMGRERPDLAAGLRCYPVERHIIYYQFSGQAVTIVRILHSRMDAYSRVEP